MRTISMLILGATLLASTACRHQTSCCTSPRTTAAPTGTNNPAVLYYTCPMHPTVKAAAPGDCPLCGMKLIPVTATP